MVQRYDREIYRSPHEPDHDIHTIRPEILWEALDRLFKSQTASKRGEDEMQVSSIEGCGKCSSSSLSSFPCGVVRYGLVAEREIWMNMEQRLIRERTDDLTQAPERQMIHN
jgi:hypothetical protein